MKFGYEQIEYSNFEKDLYDVRYELASSRVMDTYAHMLEENLIEASAKKGADGMVHLDDLYQILRQMKTLCLSPFQIAVLLGYSAPDKNAQVDYQKFAPVFAAKLSEQFSIDSQRRKSQLCQLGHFKVSHIKMPKYDENKLFAAFRATDVNGNGFLEWSEYQVCLENLTELGLTREECFTLNLLADVNGDGRIDYLEFMKHF